MHGDGGSLQSGVARHLVAIDKAEDALRLLHGVERLTELRACGVALLLLGFGVRLTFLYERRQMLDNFPYSRQSQVRSVRQPVHDVIADFIF